MIIFTIATFAPLPSSAEVMKCSLAVDGRTQFSTYCSYKAIDDNDGTDFFEDGKLVFNCPNGKKYTTTSNCPWYERKMAREGMFGYLYRKDDETASVCWNEGKLRKAELCYSGLKREGACWKSESAKNLYNKSLHAVKFCSYAL